MDILKYLKSLLPKLSRNTVTDNLRLVSEELNDTTIPLFDSANVDFSNFDFKSKEVVRLLPTFNSLVNKRKGNIITTIDTILKDVSKLSALLLTNIENDFEETIASTGLTCSKAQKLQLTEGIDFVTRYSRKLLNYIIIAETSKYDQGNTIENRLSKVQREYVTKFFSNYCILMNGFAKGGPEVLKIFNSIPNITVTPENIESYKATHGRYSLDPLQFGFIPVSLNPFYHIGMSIAEYQTNRYDEKKEERDLIKLRLINLKNQMNSTPNPKLEQEIEYYEERVQKLELKIEDMERKYGK
jgi:hypothetical protein